ncbi:MAG: ribosome-associated translation inhibitor RaiA [Deltaproteobacteria bacterium]|nr:ribosome-associated translation inhibitor RaiA [Deltaproteobacteria bacterium]
MQIDVTFRRMEPSDALKSYLNEKMTRMKKFITNPWHAHVVLTSERYRNKADVTLTLTNGLLVKGVDTSEDMYFSIDQAITRIEKQLKKYKEKIHTHKPLGGQGIKFKSHVIEQNWNEENEELPVKAEAELEEVEVENKVDIQHKIVRTNEYHAEPLELEGAVMQLELQDKKFLVFTNASTNAINVLYIREDGQYGLIETDK